MSFEEFSYLELWRLLYSVEGNHLCNFERCQHEEQFCIIILNLNPSTGARGTKTDHNNSP